MGNQFATTLLGQASASRSLSCRLGPVNARRPLIARLLVCPTIASGCHVPSIASHFRPFMYSTASISISRLFSCTEMKPSCQSSVRLSNNRPTNSSTRRPSGDSDSHWRISRRATVTDVDWPFSSRSARIWSHRAFAPAAASLPAWAISTCSESESSYHSLERGATAP